MRTPLLSVVVPAHDAAPWIGELLESVLTQDVPSMEVIVVDDRSTDGTDRVVDALAHGDERLRRVASSGPGGAAARNTGADLARGEFLVFADADDIVPSGAYRSMIDSLLGSGSDLAVGDHLKFSPTATWSPTKRWYSFDTALRRTTARATPALLTGRACWNRMFRRSFWEREDIRFPDVGHADDIVPMTLAMLRATSIDVVPGCVYLYRERGGGAAGSMSNRTDETALLDYLREEITCVRLVASSTPELLGQQSMLVLDADGWVHLDRYLAQLPDGHEVSEGVDAALTELLSQLDATVLDDVAPTRRCLVALLWAREYATAAAFADATRDPSSDPAAILRAWVDAVSVLRRSPHPAELDRHALVREGVDPAFLHHADHVDPVVLGPIVETASELARTVPDDSGSELLVAVRRALLVADATAVQLVSALRSHAPIVVDQTDPTVDSVLISGPALPPPLAQSMRLVLSAGVSSVAVTVTCSGARWSATIPAGALSPARWVVAAAFRLSAVEVTVPVVTARMPLPPLDDRYRLQPLSDRRNGWRFLVDSRPRRGVLSRARATVGRLRRPGN